MPHGKRPPSTDPYHSLMDTLRDLQERMDHTGNKIGSMSTIEAYDSFVKASEFGRNCQYSLKTLALFKLQDYNDIKDILLKIADIIKLIEGNKCQ